MRSAVLPQGRPHRRGRGAARRDRMLARQHRGPGRSGPPAARGPPLHTVAGDRVLHGRRVLSRRGPGPCRGLPRTRLRPRRDPARELPRRLRRSRPGGGDRTHHDRPAPWALPQLVPQRGVLVGRWAPRCRGEPARPVRQRRSRWGATRVQGHAHGLRNARQRRVGAAHLCRRLREGDWQIRDEFTPGYGGNQHIDLYVGEENVPNFTRSELYISLVDATLTLID